MAAYGPKALALTGEVADGFILQLADPAITEWSIAAVRKAAADAGRDPDVDHDLRRRAGLRHRRHRRRAGPRPRPVPLVRRHGRQPRRRHRRALRRRRRPAVPAGAVATTSPGAQGYDYNSHGKAGNTHTDFVPDEVIDRFCLIGPVEDAGRAAARSCEALGVDQFALYLQHDAKTETLPAYGDKVLPAVNVRKAAKT